MSRTAARLLLLCALALLPGCGFGPGETEGEVTLTVTRDFGTEAVGGGGVDTAEAGGTVMRLLQSGYEVDTRYGGGFVQEIEGVGGGREGGRTVDWFFYVNGIESSVGAAERRLYPGEDVWWDHHAWDGAQRVPAVVGSFPEPFISGFEGDRFPVRLVCEGDVERSCDEVATRLEEAGVPAVSRSTLAQSPGQEVLRIVVGTWADIRRDEQIRRLEAGPEASGVFARPEPSGQEIVLLDSAAERARTLGAGSGLVAATNEEMQAPTWIVTGTDTVGVAAAAAALTEERLRRSFAVAVDAGTDVPLPVEAGSARR